MLVEAMGKPSDFPGFKALYQEWSQKLKDSGFEDVEETRHGQRVLKKSGTMGRFEQLPTLVRESKARYFDIIGQKIVETKFSDEQEKMIMCLYFEGFNQTEIRQRLDPPLHRSTIYKKLYKWLKRWNLK